MREGWVRHAEPVSVSAEQAAALLRPVLGEVCIREIRPVAGGLVNTNLRLALDRPPGVVLLRLITREPPQARKEAALDRLLRGRVPTARFLHLAETNPVTRGPYAVLEWIEGERLDRVAARADAAALDGLGEAIGAVLARVHAFRFARHGFLTPDLRVTAVIGFDRAALLDFLRECLVRGPGGARLGVALTNRVLDFAAREGWRLDAWLDDPRLVHGDFNPSNILMRDAGVAAVLDWEFALSATPAFDFANLLRPPLGMRAGFAAALARGYRRAGGVLPADWQRIAQIADLFAWADLLGRRPFDAALAADARRVIGALVG
jgi:aminoglycoside phosphotransferase (APT) family kinase protein